MDGPRPEWYEQTCAVCPAQELPAGGFDVLARPGARFAYNPMVGWRIDRESGMAVCVHPYRVGLPPGRYASAGEALPERDVVPAPPPDPELPGDLIDLEGWLIAVIRLAPPEKLLDVVARAERTAVDRFPPGEVIAALRQVLSNEVARR